MCKSSGERWLVSVILIFTRRKDAIYYFWFFSPAFRFIIVIIIIFVRFYFFLPLLLLLLLLLLLFLFLFSYQNVEEKFTQFGKAVVDAPM